MAATNDDPVWVWGRTGGAQPNGKVLGPIDATSPADVSDPSHWLTIAVPSGLVGSNSILYDLGNDLPQAAPSAPVFGAPGVLATFGVFHDDVGGSEAPRFGTLTGGMSADQIDFANGPWELLDANFHATVSVGIGVSDPVFSPTEVTIADGSFIMDDGNIDIAPGTTTFVEGLLGVGGGVAYTDLFRSGGVVDIASTGVVTIGDANYTPFTSGSSPYNTTDFAFYGIGGRLNIGNAPAFTSSISNFKNGDTLDLTDMKPSNVRFISRNNETFIMTSNTTSLVLQNSDPIQFLHADDDGFGGTNITSTNPADLPPPTFIPAKPGVGQLANVGTPMMTDVVPPVPTGTLAHIGTNTITGRMAMVPDQTTTAPTTMIPAQS